MIYNDSWVDNNGINIHFVETNANLKEETPLVIIPGLSESAEDYISVIENLSPRHCIIITLRGRGKSATPETGYSLDDHISDIEAVVKHLELKDFILFGYSRSVSYVLKYSLQNKNLVKGLIIGDYPAIHTQLPQGWVEFFSSLPPWRGKPLSQRMSHTALYGIQKESAQVIFWDDLSSIECPVLIIRAGKPGAALSLEAGEQYLEKMPQANLVVFDESDHNIFEPNLDTFIQTIDLFMNKCHAGI
ncbi:alpha/beta fold hydrolase [Robertmurraya andreesenii]|uniref:Pimeloyl-ACP methyl ester carboxylesterase n=1 Tax=Anoxybacillus andreesenii TaxID=1325932 RepID=A0ABT9UZW7_9BACL|nr:alpha/beta hydrolase [Robertmurraya andreesenii]MDQ0154237.1 pimeloyl-ACP methyl ester carboxylesterase [Robertmurraya andreesenii]